MSITYTVPVGFGGTLTVEGSATADVVAAIKELQAALAAEDYSRRAICCATWRTGACGRRSSSARSALA